MARSIHSTRRHRADGRSTQCSALDGTAAFLACGKDCLTQAANRIAGESEIVLDTDFGGVLNLFWRSAEYLAQPGCGHGAGGADFSLAADLGA